MSESVSTSTNSAIDLRAYHPLARLRRVIRAYVLVEGIVLALILGCLWFWFSMALDFSLHHFQDIDMLDRAPVVRWIMMSLFAAGMLAVVVWYIFRRLFRDFRPASLALVLENRFPELLGDRLITAVELVDLKKAEKQGYSVAMIVRTMKEAKERVDQVPVFTVFNWYRLVLMAWSLVGVSVFLLLLVYPVCVLFSLIKMAPSPAVWEMLAVNAALVLGLIVVFAVPYFVIRARNRGPRLRWALHGLMAVVGAGTAFGYDRALKQVNSLGMHEYSWQLYHVADIGLDRNLRFGESRWPRDEYFVSWLDFPVEEKRIQYNKTINARALFTTWIIADNKSPTRWRPLQWNDLPRLVEADQLPPLPLESIREHIVKLSSGDERSPVGYDKTRLQLPVNEDIPVDLVLAAVSDPKSKYVSEADQEKFDHLAELLEERANDPKLGGRVVRKVAPPGELTLIYGSDVTKLRGRSRLGAQDQRRNVYGLEQPVKLDDAFVVFPPAEPKAGDKLEKYVPLVAEVKVGNRTLQTEPRSVVLVSPPKVQTLVYQEFRPAYYFHLPPAGPRAVTIDERRQLMRDLRQAMPKSKFTAPSEVFILPDFALGSDVAFTATSDKQLQEVTLTPRSLDFPGTVNKDDLQPLPVAISADGKSFTVRFASTGKPVRDWHPEGDPAFPLVKTVMTFDVTMKDVDNMVSTRSFTARPIEDKVPSVNLFVDVIRQIKENNRSTYVCTAKADIPFAKESVIVDEHGLHKLEFTYEYSPIVNKAFLPVLAENLAWSFANPPLMANVGDPIYRREVMLRTLPVMREIIQRDMPDLIRKIPSFGSVPIAAFDNAQGREGPGQLSLDALKTKLATPWTNDHVSPVLKRFAFKELESPLSFDLQESLPQLRERNSGGVVPNYKLTIDVRATDSNTQADSPRTARNSELLEFLIISEDDLRTLIAKEEADLVRLFNEMINDLEKHQRDLDSVGLRLPVLSSTNAIFEQNRIEKVMDAVSASRSTVAEIFNSYQRIQREYGVNRFPSKLTTDLSIKIIEPMRSVQSKEYPTADRDLNQLHAVLKQGRPELAVPVGNTTRQSVAMLLEALRSIQKEMGASVDFAKLAGGWKKVLDGQSALSQNDLRKIELEIQRELLHIRFLPAPEEVNVGVGKKVAVTLGIRMPKTIISDPILRFEIPANSGLKLPAEVQLKETAQQANFDLSAGTVPGTYFIKVVPSQGDAVELKVNVR